MNSEILYLSITRKNVLTEAKKFMYSVSKINKNELNKLATHLEATLNINSYFLITFICIVNTIQINK